MLPSNISLILIIVSKSGSVLLDSQLEIVLSVTKSLSASYCCVTHFSFLNFAILLPIFIYITN